MKRKFLIASHGNLAKGFQSSFILADKGKELAVINAYVTPEDYTPIIQTFLQSLGAEEQAIILTDLYGGSVNQKIVQEVMTTKPDNVFIISNANLAIALSLIFLKEGEKLTKEDIQAAIAEAQIQFVELNPSNEEENFFFLEEIKMITQVRVDDRLIHGQVAVVWTKELNAPLLVVANDEAAKNEVMQMTLKMAVPNGMKLLIRSVDDAIDVFNDPRGKDKRIFVIRTV